MTIVQNGLHDNEGNSDCLNFLDIISIKESLRGIKLLRI